MDKEKYNSEGWNIVTDEGNRRLIKMGEELP